MIRQMVARSVQFNQPIINNHPMTLKYEKSLGDKELYKHLLERCQLKHRPATAAKYAKASAHFKRMVGRLSEALASPGADNLVQRLTERIMNPRVGGGPQAIKVLKIHNIYYIVILTFCAPFSVQVCFISQGFSCCRWSLLIYPLPWFAWMVLATSLKSTLSWRNKPSVV